MAATVLNSPRAAEMSVFVARAFVRLRDFARILGGRGCHERELFLNWAGKFMQSDESIAGHTGLRPIPA